MLNSIISGALAHEILAVVADRPRFGIAVALAVFGFSMLAHRWYTARHGDERQPRVTPKSTGR